MVSGDHHRRRRNIGRKSHRKESNRGIEEKNKRERRWLEMINVNRWKVEWAEL